MIKLAKFKRLLPMPKTNYQFYSWFQAVNAIDCAVRNFVYFDALVRESPTIRRRQNYHFKMANRQIKSQLTEIMYFIGGHAHGKYYEVPKEMNSYQIAIAELPNLLVDPNEPPNTVPYRTEIYHREGNVMICNS